MPSVDLLQLCYGPDSILIPIEHPHQVRLVIWTDDGCQAAPVALDVVTCTPAVNREEENGGDSAILLLLSTSSIPGVKR